MRPVIDPNQWGEGRFPAPAVHGDRDLDRFKNAGKLESGELATI